MEITLESDINKLFEIKDPIRTANFPYWPAEVYGFGKQIRRFAGYPMKLPLCINTDHGVGLDSILKTEIMCDAPVQFYHAPENVDAWRKQFKKPCYVLHSPFVFYRKKNKISQSENSKGTLAYATHTTEEVDDISNVELYITDLKALPGEYHPVSICLHYHDINKGLHKTFLKHGFRVFTAGHPYDYNFIKNFYNILKDFKYTTSNMVMSCLYYSVEMGIPCLLYTSPSPRDRTRSRMPSSA